MSQCFAPPLTRAIRPMPIRVGVTTRLFPDRDGSCQMENREGMACLKRYTDVSSISIDFCSSSVKLPPWIGQWKSPSQCTALQQQPRLDPAILLAYRVGWSLLDRDNANRKSLCWYTLDEKRMSKNRRMVLKHHNRFYLVQCSCAQNPYVCTNETDRAGFFASQKRWSRE